MKGISSPKGLSVFGGFIAKPPSVECTVDAKYYDLPRIVRGLPPQRIFYDVLSGYRVWTHTLFGFNWRGTNPKITD